MDLFEAFLPLFSQTNKTDVGVHAYHALFVLLRSDNKPTPTPLSVVLVFLSLNKTQKDQTLYCLDYGINACRDKSCITETTEDVVAYEVETGIFAESIYIIFCYVEAICKAQLTGSLSNEKFKKERA